MKTQKDQFEKYRRMARHLFHQSFGKKSYVVVCSEPLYFGKRNKKFRVFEKSTYTSHSKIKRKYPYEVFRYE
tara:strand:- start:2883 stop:3098 length:216 start_codon:yes stop_codon:yes gene_type:complete